MEIGFRVEMPEDVRRIIDLLHSSFQGMVDVARENNLDNLTITIYPNGTTRTMLEKGRHIYEKCTSIHDGCPITSEAKVRKRNGEADEDTERTESTEETV